MLFLVLTPVIAEEEPLVIDIEFPALYVVNISGVEVKVIGMVGIPYQGNVTVGSQNEEANLANRSLELKFIYKDIPESEISEQKTTDRSIFWYNEGYKNFYEFDDTFDLSEKFGEKLSKGESKSFPFGIAFLETGMYKITYKEQSEKHSICSIKSKFISIIEPMEYENLLKQAQVLDAQKKSAEASEETANATKDLARITALLAFVTFVIALVSIITFRQIRKDREIDLLRKRLGNLYSMLNFHTDIFNKDLSKRDDPDYKSWMDFYKKFRENLYLGSDDLVEKAKHFLEEYVDSNEIRVHATENKQFKEDTEKLISQINSDYEKYLNRLMELTIRSLKEKVKYLFLAGRKQ